MRLKTVMIYIFTTIIHSGLEATEERNWLARKLDSLKGTTVERRGQLLSTIKNPNTGLLSFGDAINRPRAGQLIDTGKAIQRPKELLPVNANEYNIDQTTLHSYQALIKDLNNALTTTEVIDLLQRDKVKFGGNDQMAHERIKKITMSLVEPSGSTTALHRYQIHIDLEVFNEIVLYVLEDESGLDDKRTAIKYSPLRLSISLGDKSTADEVVKVALNTILQAIVKARETQEDPYTLIEDLRTSADKKLLVFNIKDSTKTQKTLNYQKKIEEEELRKDEQRLLEARKKTFMYTKRCLRELGLDLYFWNKSLGTKQLPDVPGETGETEDKRNYFNVLSTESAKITNTEAVEEILESVFKYPEELPLEITIKGMDQKQVTITIKNRYGSDKFIIAKQNLQATIGEVFKKRMGGIQVKDLYSDRCNFSYYTKHVIIDTIIIRIASPLR